MTQETPFSISDLRPAGLPDYKIPGWLGCLHWAAGDPDILSAFYEETGTPRPATDRPGEMIDKATGMDRKIITAFIKWHNENVWGDAT